MSNGTRITIITRNYFIFSFICSSIYCDTWHIQVTISNLVTQIPSLVNIRSKTIREFPLIINAITKLWNIFHIQTAKHRPTLVARWTLITQFDFHSLLSLRLLLLSGRLHTAKWYLNGSFISLFAFEYFIYEWSEGDVMLRWLIEWINFHFSKFISSFCDEISVFERTVLRLICEYL